MSTFDTLNNFMKVFKGRAGDLASWLYAKKVRLSPTTAYTRSGGPFPPAQHLAGRCTEDQELMMIYLF